MFQYLEWLKFPIIFRIRNIPYALASMNSKQGWFSRDKPALNIN